MLSFETVMPANVPAFVVERFFIANGNVPEGVVLQDKPLPSIMQSIIIDFGGTPQKAILPNGVSFNCEGDLIMGQFTKRFSSTISGRVDSIGIQFSPTGLYRLFRKPMNGFANTICYLKEFAGWHSSMRNELERAGSPEERMAILEKYLMQNLFLEKSGSLETVEQAARLMRDSNAALSLTQLCKETGMSERSMQRYFMNYIGVSPKSFMRIARFNAVTKLIEQDKPVSWQDILAETGYFDPAHFTHDFKSITGKTPSEYYKGKTFYEKFFYGN